MAGGRPMPKAGHSAAAGYAVDHGRVGGLGLVVLTGVGGSFLLDAAVQLA